MKRRSSRELREEKEEEETDMEQRRRREQEMKREEAEATATAVVAEEKGKGKKRRITSNVCSASSSLQIESNDAAEGKEEQEASTFPATASSTAAVAALPLLFPFPPRPWLNHELQSILKFSSLSELASRMRVSKQWLRVISSVMPSIGAEVHMSKLKVCSRPPLASLCRSAVRKHIRSLIGSNKYEWNSENMCMIAESLPQLHTLGAAINLTYGSPFFLLPTQLRSLTLKGIGSHSAKLTHAQTVIDAIGEVKSLEEFTLQWQLTARRSQQIRFKPLIALAHLQLFEYSLIMPPDTSEEEQHAAAVLSAEQIDAIRSMKNLTQLNLFDGRVSAELLAGLVREAVAVAPPTEKNLDASLNDSTRMNEDSAHNGSISDTQPQQQIEQITPLSKLTHLQLNNTILTDAHCAALAQLPTLTDLMPEAWECTSRSLLVVDQLRSLTSLNFQFPPNTRVTAEVILQVLADRPQLTKLVLQHPLINSKHLTQLLPSLPMLNNLGLYIMPQLNSLSFLSITPIKHTLQILLLQSCRHPSLTEAELVHVEKLSALHTLQIHHSFAVGPYVTARFSPSSALHPNLIMPHLQTFDYIPAAEAAAQ